MSDSATKTICLAISGASGFPYAQRLLQCLLQKGCRVHLLISDAAREVARLEMGLQLPEDVETLRDFLLNLLDIDLQQTNAQLHCYTSRDWLSPVASGSAHMDAMVVCPCSTGTLAAIATGQSHNLIQRAATVTLKESRRLIIMPRETPVSAIQLEHMLKLSQLGVRIVPASPGFYQQPKTVADLIDFMVARLLQQLDIPHDLLPQWGME
ncbi:MAG: UbiX family flavin prenyltransferase [Pseudomonadales bacterium]|nr:UbiX family flavin prenyltransferase [Pseudomonadales bacterium]